MQAAQNRKYQHSIMTYEMIREYFECEYVGRMPVKYEGDVEMYIRFKPEFAADDSKTIPNQNLLSNIFKTI